MPHVVVEDSEDDGGSSLNTSPTKSVTGPNVGTASLVAIENKTGSSPLHTSSDRSSEKLHIALEAAHAALAVSTPRSARKRKAVDDLEPSSPTKRPASLKRSRTDPDALVEQACDVPHSPARSGASEIKFSGKSRGRNTGTRESESAAVAKNAGGLPPVVLGGSDAVVTAGRQAFQGVVVKMDRSRAAAAVADGDAGLDTAVKPTARAQRQFEPEPSSPDELSTDATEIDPEMEKCRQRAKNSNIEPHSTDSDQEIKQLQNLNAKGSKHGGESTTNETIMIKTKYSSTERTSPHGNSDDTTLINNEEKTQAQAPKKRGRGRPRKNDTLPNGESTNKLDDTPRGEDRRAKEEVPPAAAETVNDSAILKEKDGNAKLSNESLDNAERAKSHALPSTTKSEPQEVQADKDTKSPTRKHSPIKKEQVPHRVGLSKRIRIEPLLKRVRH